MAKNLLFTTVLPVLLAYPLSIASAQAPEDDSGGQADHADLAAQLQNPIADLISVPLQNNFDFGIGQEDAFRYTLNIQPVIPISLSKNWNLLSRTIVPIIYEEQTLPGGDDHAGLGDILQSLFFVPAGSRAITWGVGPALSLPTATSDALGSEQWALGPTAVVLAQPLPWTLGVLANHLWSVAGSDDRADVNATYLQPFASYTTSKATSFTASLEAVHDWEGDNSWSVPAILGVGQVLKIAEQPANVTLAGKYWLAGPDAGPDWGARLVLTLLFPRSPPVGGAVAGGREL
jgi:hypothetical protein